MKKLADIWAKWNVIQSKRSGRLEERAGPELKTLAETVAKPMACLHEALGKHYHDSLESLFKKHAETLANSNAGETPNFKELALDFEQLVKACFPDIEQTGAMQFALPRSVTT